MTDSSTKRINSRLVVSALTAVSLWLVFSVLSPANAEQGAMPRIVAAGEGSSQLAPDMATLQLTVTRESGTARDALDANSAAVEKVLSAIREKGIEDRDLQTSNLSIHPRYSRVTNSATGGSDVPKIVGYIVRNSITVRIRDIQQVGSILDLSVGLGVNEGGNITFGNADPTVALERARTAAVKDALARIATIAAAAEVKTGRILEISELSTLARPLPMAHAEMQLSRAASAVPIATGENTYRVSVTVSVAIGN